MAFFTLASDAPTALAIAPADNSSSFFAGLTVSLLVAAVVTASAAFYPGRGPQRGNMDVDLAVAVDLDLDLAVDLDVDLAVDLDVDLAVDLDLAPAPAVDPPACG